MATDNRIERNRAVWAVVNAEHTDRAARTEWASPHIRWGMFGVPESELQVLGDVGGLDVLDLACGTAYFSAWLARRGARPVGVDLSREQLRTARRCQDEFGVSFPLVEGNAEHLPLPDGSFDLVLSEHGAGVWCRPGAWVGEAARVLRPGGRLVFLVNSLLSALCVPTDSGPAGDRLLRGQRDVEEVTWPGGGTEFHLSHGGWIQLLRGLGFVVDSMHELYPEPGSTSPAFYDAVSAEWAARWPAEELWVAHLPGAPRPADDAGHASP